MLKYIAETDGKYSVNEDGEVFNNVTGKWLKQRVSDKGYLCVALTWGGVTRTRYVHRLLAMAFIGDPPATDSQVNHIDGNKTNNALNNLEWCSPLQNTTHAVTTGLKPSMKGANNKSAILNEAQVIDIRKLLAVGVPSRTVAAMYGVDFRTIGNIKARRKWKHI